MIAATAVHTEGESQQANPVPASPAPDYESTAGNIDQPGPAIKTPPACK